MRSQLSCTHAVACALPIMVMLACHRDAEPYRVAAPPGEGATSQTEAAAEETAEMPSATAYRQAEGRSGAGAHSDFRGAGDRYALRGPAMEAEPPRDQAAPSPAPAPRRREARLAGAPMAAPPALPQSGVLASTFVGGGGVRARLDDLLDRGVTIDGERVRLEAFQDRERLPYPVPATEGMAMYAELERSRLHSGAERVHLQVALLGRRGEAPRRPRMHVRLLLDRSGSMRGEKWSYAVAAARALVERLKPRDTFALISYADQASLDVPPRAVGNGAAAKRAIAALVPGGGTNIGMALELAERNAPRRAAGEVGLHVLVSDGRVSVGQTNADALGAMSRRVFDEHGVLTTAIGLGTDFDERTMLSIAREGSGSYHFVRRSVDIGDILTDELDERAQAVAQALRVRVELSEGVVARRVYGSRLLDEREHAAVRATEVATDERIARELGIRSDRGDEDERGLRIHLPTFRRGDQHIILMELDVPAGSSTTQVARVTLDYKDLGRRRNERIVREVEAPRVTGRGDAQASVERLVKRTVLAFQAGEALQGAASALRRGDRGAAGELLAQRQELLRVAASHWRDPALQRDAELLARYQRVLQGAWDGFDHSSRNTLLMAMNYFGDRRMR